MEYTSENGRRDGLVDQIKKPFCTSISPVLISELVRERWGINGLEKMKEKGLNLPDLSNVPQENIDAYLKSYHKYSNLVLLTETVAVGLVGLTVSSYAVFQSINWDYFFK